MKRRWLAITLLGSMLGCSAKNEWGPPVPDPNDEILAEIKSRMSELERNSAAQLTMLKKSLDNTSNEFKSVCHDLQQQILLKDQRIAGLEARIQQLQIEVRSLKQAQEQQTIALPTNPSPRWIDPFPVRVFGVEGRKIVTDSHATVRNVETDEIYKDVFGHKVKRTRQENVQVDEYGYQVGFSVENLTQASVEISVSAGTKTDVFTIPAGQILNQLAVDSALGADLTVMVGGYTRRFPVTY